MSATAAARSPMASTGQTSLDPVNMPNNMADLPTASASEFELNLDDYTWSISSAGPLEYDDESISSWDRVPSVHIDRRGEGSVCLTPSYCTSFGPNSDYEPFSPVSYMSRLPSPDLAWRMLEDVPPTPMTATSWGAPLSFPPSPAAFSYAPSIDIAARHMSSRPVTPTTATSWGAPLSFPPSPVVFSRPISPDLGARYASSVLGSPRRYPRAPPPDAQPYGFVYPYYDAPHASTWQHVWPYTEREQTSNWPHVWPYTQGAHPAEHTEDAALPVPATRVVSHAPEQSAIPRTLNPSSVREISRAPEPFYAIEVPNATLSYPVLDLYPAVYPSFDIYPALLTLDHHTLSTPVVSSGAAYPVFDLYPAVYPSFAIYPPVLALETQFKKPSVRLSPSYPMIELYPAVYPNLVIYPSVSTEIRHAVATNAVDKPPSAVSPHVYSEYPDFNIYPAVHDVDYTAYPWSLETIYPAKLELDLTAYPWSLLAIYPVAKTSSKAILPAAAGEQLQAHYPTFDIYPSVYPYNLDRIYPSVCAEMPSALVSETVCVGVEWQYPVFDIYPSVGASGYSAAQEVTFECASVYPIINIYPAVYPWNVYEIYPVHNTPVAKDDGIPVPLSVEYPFFNIYPPVYPHFVLYPTLVPGDNSIVEVHLNGKEPMVSQYPFLVIYPAVYPCIEIYPGSWGHLSQPAVVRSSAKVATKRRPKFTHMELRAQVMAAAKPSSVSVLALVAQRRSPKYTHMELREQVFAKARAAVPNAVMVPPVPTAAPTPTAPTPALMPSSAPMPRSAISSAGPTSSRELPAPAPPVRAPSPTPKSILRRSISPARPPVPAPPMGSIPVPPRVSSPIRAPTSDRSSSPSQAPAQRSRPTAMDLQEGRRAQHMEIPKIVAVEPSPTTTNESPGSPLLFEMVTAPSPTTAPVSAPPTGPLPSSPSRVRSRSGTVNARPASVAGVRQVSAYPGPPPSSELPPVPPIPSPAPSPQRSINRLSGLPPHPAVNRRVSSSAAPRPMSTFGPLPSVPEPFTRPAPSPILKRQMSLMSPLAEEGRSPVGSRSPQLPSPADDWRGSRTPDGSSDSPLRSGMADLSRSKTMPTRATPRGPRSSTLIMERSKAFANPNVVPNDDGPLKLSMSALAEFPAPPLPPMPTSASSPSRPVSKLDKSRYPFQ